MNFTTTITIERHLYNLSFSPVYTANAFKLFVQAIDQEGEAVGFEMRKDRFNKWQITLPAPEWAIKYKRHLVDLAKDNF